MKDPVTVDVETTIDDVAKKMSEESVGSVIVLEEDVAKGIITKGDIVRRVVAKNIRPSEVKAKDVMSSPLMYVTHDRSLEDALKVMDENNISHLAVFKGSKLIGVITATDIIHLAPPLIEHLKINARGGRHI